MERLILPGLVGCLVSLLPAQSVERRFDPVVVAGDRLPLLLGADPARVVGFRYDKGWVQVPVQVDQRAVVSFTQIRQQSKYQASALVYCDPLTFTGADPDPTLDQDDELVFLHQDAGGPAGPGEPPGVVKGVRQSLAVQDPLGGPRRHLHLFLSLGGLRPGAGKDLVSYSYNLLSGSYKSTYQLGGGRWNPEDSWAVTAAYRVRFRDRWIHDVTLITTPGAGGADILDRHKFQFAPGICSRTTDTFSLGGGAMIANLDGPVRAIRSVVGANSGVITQRDWFFHPESMVVRTHLRVHAIQGTWNFYDYSPQAAGMRYFDNHNLQGVPIDGKPDPVATGKLDWQLVTGAQGSLAHSFLIDTDLAKVVQGSFYDDDLTPSWSQCTGDAWAYGAAGPTTGGLPNLDPLRGPANRFVLDRVIRYGPPGWTPAEAAAFDRASRHPLAVQAVTDMRFFGKGCTGSLGPLRLDGWGAPLTGEKVTLRAAPFPAASPGLLLLGASDRRWGALPLPLDLTPLGLTGCALLTAADLSWPRAPAGGEERVTLAIPADPALVGASCYAQYLALDPLANPAGLVTSGGVAIPVDS